MHQNSFSAEALTRTQLGSSRRSPRLPCRLERGTPVPYDPLTSPRRRLDWQYRRLLRTSSTKVKHGKYVGNKIDNSYEPSRKPIFLLPPKRSDEGGHVILSVNIRHLAYSQIMSEFW